MKNTKKRKQFVPPEANLALSKFTENEEEKLILIDQEGFEVGTCNNDKDLLHVSTDEKLFLVKATYKVVGERSTTKSVSVKKYR